MKIAIAANGLGAVLARLSAHAHYCHQVGVIMHQAVLQRPQMRIFVPIIAQKKPGCATNTTGFSNRSGGFPPDVLSDSRYAMSGLHHYTGKFKQKVPAGPRKWACGYVHF